MHISLKYNAELAGYKEPIDTTIAQLETKRVVQRIWNIDHTVWQPSPDEISNRVGWLTIPQRMLEDVPRIKERALALRNEGVRRILLLGMGGSALAAEMYAGAFGHTKGAPRLSVLDSTDPDAVDTQLRRLDVEKTAFIVSTKSGGTVETLSLFKFFYNRICDTIGKENAGSRFIAITDPGSGLADLAARLKFKYILLNDPEIGGRFSALSYFGLFPAAVIGMDIDRLLKNAVAAAAACSPGAGYPANPGAWLGATLGSLARQGRNKLTFLASAPLAPFGDWLEQLIAESTGKEGTGIVPVIHEPIGTPRNYGADRFFVSLETPGDTATEKLMQRLHENGFPVIRFFVDEPYELGAQIFLWEFATAVAGSVLNINPFDQPNVEAAKAQARKMLSAYTGRGTLHHPEPAVRGGEITVYADIEAPTPGDFLKKFLATGKTGDYVALQAYVDPTKPTVHMLQELRGIIRNQTRLATSLGFGPRYLHSTGQLHKGDGGNGLFIQISSDKATDFPIPDEPGAARSSITFGTLETAQAWGDWYALRENGRRVIRFHISQPLREGLLALKEALLSLPPKNSNKPNKEK
jgi:glucose-6-phosphate isomerase